MGIRFLGSGHVSGAEVQTRAERFFQSVLARLPRDLGELDQAEPRARLEAALTAEAGRLSSTLVVEVDRVGEGARIVVAPAEDGALGPVLDGLLPLAPEHPRVSFVRHRPALDVAVALADVRARRSVNLEGARVRVGFSRGHLLEAVVYCPAFTTAVDEALLDAADLLVRRLVGDAVFDDWFAAVDVAPLPRGGALRVVSDGAVSREDTLPLEDLLPATLAAVRAVDGELPEAPYHVFCERAEWLLLELTPEERPDYGGLDDLALFATMLPEAAKSFLEGARFSSRRFSKHGERFLYVKIDAPGVSAEERFELRTNVEDALNVALVPGRLGCVVGAGTGLRYVYLLLAFERLDAGLEVARRRLRKIGVAERSWVVSCDTDWAGAWVPVWEDAPAPP